MRFCPFCRAGVEPGQRFCVECGSSLPAPQAGASPGQEGATQPLPPAAPGAAGWSAPQEQAGPDAARRRTPWVAAVAAGVLVLAAAGAGGWYVWQDDATQTTATAGGGEGPGSAPGPQDGEGDAKPDDRATPDEEAPEPAPTVTLTVTPKPEPPPEPEPEPEPEPWLEGGLVDWSAVSGHRQGPTVGGLFEAYFSGINTGDWTTVLSLYNPHNPNLPPQDPDTFIEGTDTTTDSDVVVHSLGRSGGVLQAHVTFRSRQHPSDSPDGTGLTCTDWSMIYTLVRVGGSWRIDDVDAADGSSPYRAC